MCAHVTGSPSSPPNEREVPFVEWPCSDDPSCVRGRRHPAVANGMCFLALLFLLAAKCTRHGEFFFRFMAIKNHAVMLGCRTRSDTLLSVKICGRGLADNSNEGESENFGRWFRDYWGAAFSFSWIFYTEHWKSTWISNHPQDTVQVSWLTTLWDMFALIGLYRLEGRGRGVVGRSKIVTTSHLDLQSYFRGTVAFGSE